MLNLWIVFFLLLLIALTIAVLPVLSYRKGMMKAASRAQERQQQSDANLAVYRDRFQELQTELDAGVIDEATFRELTNELEASLLADLPEDARQDKTAASAPGRRHASVPLLALLIIGLPAIAISFYAILGNYDGLETRQWLTETRRDLDNATSMDDFIQRLRNRVEADPEQSEGWGMLGQAYMNTNRYPEAVDAFEKLVVLERGSEERIAAAYGMLARARFFRDRRLTEDTQLAIDAALERNPAEATALSIQGLAAFQAQQFDRAVRSWEQLLAAHPEYESADAIRAGITRAKELKAENAGGSPADTNARVLVDLSLSPDLEGEVSGDEAVFLLARPPGTRMPVAVTRLQVNQLPARIQLDDSLSMGPMAKLSSADVVEVVARVAKSGTPQATSGDLEGSLQQVSVQDGSPVVLTIDRVLK